MRHFVSIIMAGLCALILVVSTVSGYTGALIVDHRHTDITQIPQSVIEQAKTTLHIAYGHTSHGSQVTTGLVAFANGDGKVNMADRLILSQNWLDGE